MPAQSEKQRKLFGAALATKRGAEPISKNVSDIAKKTSEKELSKMASKNEGSMSEVFVVTAPYPGCTSDSMVKKIDPLNGLSGTDITPDQVKGVYPDADQAASFSTSLYEEYEKSQKMLEEKKGTTTEKLKKAIDKLEKKRKEHMDAMKEDPKKASDHKEAVANIVSKIDDYLTKLEKIEKSKKADEKEKINEAPRVTVQQLFTSLDSKNLSNDKLEDLEYVKKLIDTTLDKEYDTVADNPEELAKQYISKRKKDKKPIEEAKNHYTPRGYISNLEQAWKKPADAYKDLSTFLKDVATDEEVYGEKKFWLKSILSAVKEEKGVIKEAYEVHFSDGVRQRKVFKDPKSAINFAKQLISTNKSLKHVDVFNAGPNFHSTADTDSVIAWWGDGSYMDNKAKEDSKLASKKIQ